MSMNFTVPDVNIISVFPEIILLITGTLLLFVPCESWRNKTVPLIASIGVILQGLAGFCMWGKGITGFDGLIARDNVSFLFQGMIGTATLVAIIFSHYYLRQNKRCSGEYYSLIIYALVGMDIMVAATDLVVIFLGMEILSLSMYVLVGFFKETSESIEASVKYFLLGGLSSAIFLFGISFFYGAWGQTGITVLSTTNTGSGFNAMLLMTAITLLCAGLGFKIAAVPFHMWAPDTYEGAPVSIASLLSVAPKIAAFAVFLRIASGIFDLIPHSNSMSYAVVVMSVTSMVLGNFAALRQTGLIRMLAYSGIAQVGFMLIGLLAVPCGGGSALIFYLFTYLFMNMGAFGIATYLSVTEGKRLIIDDLKGLATDRPLLALAMAIFMISLAGIPPTAGFFAKFYVFKTGIEAGYLWVVIVAIVMTVIALYYYLRVIMVMYMGEASEEGMVICSGVNIFSILLGLLAEVW